MNANKYALEEPQKKLVQEVRNFEFKIIQTFIQSRNLFIFHDYCKGKSHPVIPNQWDRLIIAKDDLKKEFDELNLSKAACENRELFLSEIKVSIESIESDATADLCKKIFEDMLERITKERVFLVHNQYRNDLLDYIKNVIANESESKKLLTDYEKGNNDKPTYVQYALYYCYLQKAGIKEWFENWDGGIENAYKEVCRVEGLNAKTSWQKFRNEYRKIKDYRKVKELFEWFSNNMGKPRTSFTFLKEHRRVNITGVGFWDFLHGQKGMANNGREIHPVLSMKLI